MEPKTDKALNETYDLVGEWSYLDLEGPGALDAEQIQRLLCGRIAGIRIQGMVTPEECEAVMERVTELGMGAYDGMAKPLGTFGINHWTARYVDGDYPGYFNGAAGEEKTKIWLFEPLSAGPSEIVKKTLEPALGVKIERLRDDKGRQFNAVILRSGTAAAHYDFGRFDLPQPVASRVIRQMAWNIYLQNPGEGGELVVYRQLGVEPGLTKAEAAARGLSSFGNYDLDSKSLQGVPAVTIPARQGDFVLVNNQYIHAVAPVSPPELTGERVAISAHIAQLTDGSFCEFS